MTPEQERKKNFDKLYADNEFVRRGYVTADRLADLLANPIFKLFTDPRLSSLQVELHDYLYGLGWEPENGLEVGLSLAEIGALFIELKSISNGLGLVSSSQIEAIEDRGKVELVDLRPKYKEWEDLVDLAEKWESEDKIVGLVHGAFDPPHIGHSHLFATVRPCCHHLLVGFDSNQLLRSRKGGDRPRFPQLAWRMAEVASLPTVDYVFKMPVEKVERERYIQTYKQLRIDILGIGSDNPLVDEFQYRMLGLGGLLVKAPREGHFSSTIMLERLRDDELTKSVTKLPEIRGWAEEMNQFAINMGFPAS